MQREGRHALSHAGIYLVARGLPGIIAFLAIPLFSRLLMPEDYGRYALVMATVGLLNALLFQWLRLSLVRYLPAFKDDPARLKSTLITSSLLLIAILGVVAGVACLLPIAHGWRAVIGACWVMLAVQTMFELSCEYARSALQPWQYMVLQVMRSSAIIGLGATLMLLGWGWWGPLIGGAAGMALAVAWVYRRQWADVRLTIDRPALAKVCQYGLPLSMTVALTVVISSSDRFLIAGFMGEGAAGLYSVAVDFTSQTLTLLMLVINMAMFPIAVRAWEHHGREAAQAQMRSNAALLMAVGVPCVIGMTVLAPGIANCFLGQSYRATAAQIVPLVALGAFLAGFKAYHFDAAFQFAHRTIYQVWIVLFAAIVNLGLNWIAIPRWGINGAAGASVVAFLVSIALTAWLGRNHFALPFPVGACARVLIAGTAMAGAVYPFRSSVNPFAVAAQIAGGAATYVATLLACNFLGLRDSIMAKCFRGITGPAAVTLPEAHLADAQIR
jgi:O-antigen/teichoic acid export membrane protein